MNRPELFDWSVATLAQAFLEGNLEHTNCAACAVGNLIAATKGYELKGDWKVWYKGGKRVMGGDWFAYIIGADTDTFELASAKEELRDLGYTLDELKLIERAFENRGSSYVTVMQSATYDDLAAVYECLCDIHEVEAIDRVNPEDIFISKEQNEQTGNIREVTECISTGA